MTGESSGLLQSIVAGVALAIILGGAGWFILGSPDSVPLTGVKLDTRPQTEPVFIVVESGDTASTIGKRLEAADVIDSAASFQRLASITGTETTLVAGEYEFMPGTSALDALTRIRDGLTAARIVTIPEGLRLEEIADLMQARGIVSANQFLTAANGLATAGTNVDEGLLASRPPSATLEGYVFPATYSFSRRVTPEEVVLQMVKTLSERFTPALREEATAAGLSVHEVLTLASIVEREAVIPEEMPVIASVYLNRLAAGMPLQADPTVQYAITSRPGSVVEFGYWKRELSLQDLQYESSYNTYVQPGLPPGPIANPGLAAITAVIRPASTDYLFFVARNDGSHAFSETFEQHQIHIEQFQP